MKRGKQEGPRYWGPSCLRPCCTFTPASRCKIFPALTLLGERRKLLALLGQRLDLLARMFCPKF
jgi:hypothetical protein